MPWVEFCTSCAISCGEVEREVVATRPSLAFVHYVTKIMCEQGVGRAYVWLFFYSRGVIEQKCRRVVTKSVTL